MKIFTKKNAKKVIAVFLALIMVITYVLSNSADRTLQATAVPEEEGEIVDFEEEGLSEETVAISIPEEEPVQEIVQEETPEPVVEPEPVQEPEETVEPQEPAQEEVTVDLPSNEEETPENTVTEPENNEPEPTQETEIVPEETEEPVQQEITPEETTEPEVPQEQEETTQPEVISEETEEIQYTAKQISTYASDGAYIVVNAPEGVLPDGSYVTAYVMSSSSARQAIENVLDATQELVDFVVYDITIYDGDGNEIQPDGRVSVSITGANIQSGDNASVFHLEDNGQAQKVTDISDPQNASFTADHFSGYVVTTTNNNTTSDTNVTLAVGETITLIPPSGYSSTSWSSGNTSIASVDSNGKVTFIGTYADT